MNELKKVNFQKKKRSYEWLRVQIFCVSRSWMSVSQFNTLCISVHSFCARTHSFFLPQSPPTHTPPSQSQSHSSLWIMNETKRWNRFTPLTSRRAGQHKTIRTTYPATLPTSGRLDLLLVSGLASQLLLQCWCSASGWNLHHRWATWRRWKN